jgi:PAT family beta-lactamase induction signal transducer AmpG
MQKLLGCVPTTFFMESLSACMIMLVLAIMYKIFGISNSEITLYTGAMVLPWVIKPLWASLIDAIYTTRWWIYTMQVLVGIAFIVMALSLKTQNFLIFSLVVGWFIAFMSSGHDIAADGFYIQNLSPEQQSYFVGIQSAAYNVGKIFATGLILMLCGVLYNINHNYVISWSICLVLVGCVCILMSIYHRKVLPHPPIQQKQTLNYALKNFIDVYKISFKIKNLWLGLAFTFLFKFSESMIGAILPLFMVDKLENGGLNLGNTFTGFAYGTISPVAIILGGFLGGYYIYRKGFGIVNPKEFSLNSMRL